MPALWKVWSRFSRMNLFNVIFIHPILNLLLLFSFVFNSIALPFSFGFAIVALTVFIRLVIAPLTAVQLKSALKTSALRPKLTELQKKHGADKQALARAQMELYKEHGVNPASGCLPLILQIPVFIALYQVLLQVLGNGANLEAVNQYAYASFLRINSLDLNFFGFNLATRPSDFAKIGVQLLLIPPITAALQYWQSKMMMPATQQPQRIESSQEKKPTTEDALAQMQSQMVWLMPAMIGFFSFGFPVGLSLYWNVFTVFGIIQQHWISKKITLKKIFNFAK